MKKSTTRRLSVDVPVAMYNEIKRVSKERKCTLARLIMRLIYLAIRQNTLENVTNKQLVFSCDCHRKEIS